MMEYMWFYCWHQKYQLPQESSADWVLIYFRQIRQHNEQNKHFTDRILTNDCKEIQV